MNSNISLIDYNELSEIMTVQDATALKVLASSDLTVQVILILKLLARIALQGDSLFSQKLSHALLDVSRTKLTDMDDAEIRSFTHKICDNLIKVHNSHMTTLNTASNQEPEGLFNAVNE